MNDDKEKSHSHSIRFPQELYERIHQLAKRGMRSFNSQVIFLLMCGLDAEDPKSFVDFPYPPIQDYVKDIIDSHE